MIINIFINRTDIKDAKPTKKQANENKPYPKGVQESSARRKEQAKEHPKQGRPPKHNQGNLHHNRVRSS